MAFSWFSVSFWAWVAKPECHLNKPVPSYWWFQHGGRGSHCSMWKIFTGLNSQQILSRCLSKVSRYAKLSHPRGNLSWVNNLYGSVQKCTPEVTKGLLCTWELTPGLLSLASTWCLVLLGAMVSMCAHRAVTGAVAITAAVLPASWARQLLNRVNWYFGRYLLLH